MALVEIDLFGNKRDKVATSIERIRAFEPPEGYYLGFSGGKDSVVVKALCDMADVKYDAHYNVTTVDPPELVRFIKNNYPDVIFDKPTFSMWQLIEKKQYPPTRLARYCCEFLKEKHGKGRVTLTGVRWAESAGRRNNQGPVTIIGKTEQVMRTAAENSANFTKTRGGGVVLNLDNDAERRTVEQCYRTNKTLVNPIIDWADGDVWEFIEAYNIPYCCLYDEGFTRLGCIGCPLGGHASQQREFARWPAYKKLYIKAFDRMLITRGNAGKHSNSWKSGEDVFKWWIGETKRIDDAQISFFDEETINNGTPDTL